MASSSYEELEYYGYATLPRGCIRLFRILPDPTPWSRETQLKGQLEVEIEIHRLDSNIPFDALSYTWGPSTLEEEYKASQQIFTTVARCFPVLCDGKIIRVTKSLRDALRRLRIIDLPTQGDYFEEAYERRKCTFTWADGICINQDDLLERSRQVVLMPEVYGLAQSVHVYVGESTRGSRMALRTTLSIARIGSKLQHRGYKPNPSDFDNPDFYRSVGEPKPSSQDWSEWVAFFNRLWFTRTWVLQEAIIGGKENCVLLCGSQSMRLSHVLSSLAVITPSWGMSIFTSLKGSPDLDLSYESHLSAAQRWLGNQHPFGLVFSAIQSGRSMTFYSLARYVLSYTACSDARDKVYGILGFTNDEFTKALLDSDATHDIVADYTVSTEHIYCQATKAAIIQSTTLEVLSLNQMAPPGWKKLSELPSWCPDYSMPHSILLLMEDSSSRDPIWSASGRSKPSLALLALPWNILGLKGIPCNVVQATVQLNEWREPPFTSLYHFISFVWNTIQLWPYQSPISIWESCVKTISTIDAMGWAAIFQGVSKLISQDEHFTAFGCALAAVSLFRLEGMEPSQQSIVAITSVVKQLDNVVQELRAIFRAGLPSISALPDTHFLLGALREWQQQDHQSTIGGNRWPLDHYHVTELYKAKFSDIDFAVDVAFDQYMTKMDGLRKGRCMFRTNEGRIGMTHQTAEAGDQVWLLSGSYTPFVLRPTNDGNFTIIGEAYVDGVMFGELWPATEDELQIKLKDVKIV